MRADARLRVAAVMLSIASGSCTSLREIPRGEINLRPERQRVRVVTRDALVYEFDYARVVADSLYGYRRRDVEGPFDEFTTVGLRLEDVDRLSIRGMDWRRTGLIGGGALAALVGVGLARANSDNRSGSSGGGKGVIP